MNILVINTMRVPSGEASVNRILSYSKGLAELGDSVAILSTAIGTTEWNEIDGVRYKMLRNSSSFYSFILTIGKLVSYIISNRKSIDAAIIVTSSPLLSIPIQIVCKSCGCPIIQEKSEYPFVYMRSGIVNKILAYLYNHIVFRLFDGMIIMTEPLMRFYRQYTSPSCKFIKIPMTVDMSRFSKLQSITEYGDYAAYCGNMSGNKDGVLNLIEAFVPVEKKYPEFKLLMMGGTNSEEEFLKIKNRVKELELKNVIFTGRVNREAIPSLLASAKMLCLARPSSKQSEGGFPTKLGEYLSTGKPVVVTAVGDIPSYLSRDNSYIVEPDDNVKFSEMMIEILDNYQHAEVIGARGRKVAEENFNYKAQSLKIHEYLETFVK